MMILLLLMVQLESYLLKTQRCRDEHIGRPGKAFRSFLPKRKQTPNSDDWFDGYLTLWISRFSLVDLARGKEKKRKIK